MATIKNDRIYVRVNSDIKEEFEKVAEYRGLKTSTLLHSLIVKTIHEMKENSPQVFETDNLKAILPTNEKLNFSGQTRRRTNLNKEEKLLREIDDAERKQFGEGRENNNE